MAWMCKRELHELTKGAEGNLRWVGRPLRKGETGRDGQKWIAHCKTCEAAGQCTECGQATKPTPVAAGNGPDPRTLDLG